MNAFWFVSWQMSVNPQWISNQGHKTDRSISRCIWTTVPAGSDFVHSCYRHTLHLYLWLINRKIETDVSLPAAFANQSIQSSVSPPASPQLTNLPIVSIHFHLKMHQLSTAALKSKDNFLSWGGVSLHHIIL